MAKDVKNLIGNTVQGWQLTSELGQGADGIVYAVERAGERAAMKLFFPDALAKNGLEAAKERLDLQLSLVGMHLPNLVQVYAGGFDDELGTLFILMELIPGKSLDKVLKEIPDGAIRGLVKQLANAAIQLERQGLVHRDIKPANIVISDDFKNLTLLDLGILSQVSLGEDDERLSGDEFVATLRYSPPEFVWREEESNEPQAWQAVTFYQIGATIHDILMKVPLFSGFDTPRAKLYESVKGLTPTVECAGENSWLVPVVQGCLVKNWRDRIAVLKWESFDGPPSIADVEQRTMSIRLRQIRREEVRRAEALKQNTAPKRTREEELWDLNAAVFSEIRTFLQANPIFPRSSAQEFPPNGNLYVSCFSFDEDPALGFPKGVEARVSLKPSPDIAEATEISFESKASELTLVKATWTEMFNVEGAYERCRQALFDSVDLLLTKE